MAKAQIERWVPPRERPEGIARAETEEFRAQAALERARRAVATNKFQTAALELAADQVEKWLRLSQHPDYANVVGPLDPKQIISLVELVLKYAPPAGQDTGGDGAPRPGLADFAKLTAAERETWKRLAAKTLT
jgi:hypothetical protein